mgnify:CR=1 FL=1
MPSGSFVLLIYCSAFWFVAVPLVRLFILWFIASLLDRLPCSLGHLVFFWMN